MEKSRVEHFLEIAKTVASRSPCSRRQFGAVLVLDGDIIATGYNGSVRGAINCGTDIPCAKDIHNEAHYTSYFMCPAVHAEANACLAIGRRFGRGSTMFLNSTRPNTSTRPCQGCRRVLMQTGVKDLYYVDRNGNIRHEMVSDWIEIENEFMRENIKDEPNYEEQEIEDEDE